MKLVSGRSKRDRISFTSKNNCVAAIRDENGEIKICYENDDSKVLGKSLMRVFILFGVISLIKAFVIMPLISNYSINVIWYLWPAFVYVIIVIFAINSVRKTGGEEFLRNHGAEHKVYAAYKKLNRVPNIEEAQGFSRISKGCGVTLYSGFIVCQIIGFVVFLKTGYKISEIILFFIPLLFSAYFPLNTLGMIAQLFTTSEPKEKNIKLAIAALSALEKKEQIFEDLFKSIEKILNN